MYVAVMAWTDDGRIAKYREFYDEKDALAHVDLFRRKYPGAFVAPYPETSFSNWMVNQNKNALVVKPPFIFDGAIIRSAKDVDAVTRQRIESEFPVVTQIHRIMERDVDSAAFDTMRTRIRQLRNEASDFKTSMGW